MKTLYISILFFITFSITHSQDITSTLAGNTSEEGFSVVNAQGDTVFRITGEGNVGVNTATPTALFDVQGGASISGDGRNINIIAEKGATYGNEGGDILLKGGKAYLHDGDPASISIGGGKPGPYYGSGGDIDIFSGYGDDGGDISIKSGGSEVIAGDILIETGGSNQAGGSIFIHTGENNTGGGDIEISTGYAGMSGNDITLHTGFNDAGGGDIYLETSGNTYGSGDIILTPNGGLVIVNGSGTYSGTWTQASDQRFKKNINPLENNLNSILQLNGVSYEFNTEEYPERNFSEGKQIGLIAQEVEKVFPELVETNSEGYKSIAYQNMVAVLVEAVKEQQSIIDMQDEIINNMNQRLEKIENRISNKEITLGD